MSASYLSWPGASAEIPDERASLFRPGVLLDGPLHGYAIIQRAEHLSGGRVRLATGTLYTALDRLTAEGLVDLVSEAIVNGRARRSYGLASGHEKIPVCGQITPAGWPSEFLVHGH